MTDYSLILIIGGVSLLTVFTMIEQSVKIRIIHLLMMFVALTIFFGGIFRLVQEIFHNEVIPFHYFCGVVATYLLAIYIVARKFYLTIKSEAS